MSAPEASSAHRRDEIATHLAGHRAKYVSFVRGHLHDPALAEDIVQEALTRALAGWGTLRGDVDPWFFRALRNAIVDHLRRRGASARALELLEREPEHASAPLENIRRACPCVLRLQQELKPEYADALQQVEIDQRPVKEFAQATGISATNAGVRVHRAREALRRRVVATCGACAAGGCIDCNCVSAAPSSEPR